MMAQKKGMKITAKQIEAIISLPGPKRYWHFVKVVVDWEEAWGLWDAGWAMAGTEDGNKVFPLWPAKEYAEICAVDEWTNYKPEAINLKDLLENVLPQLRDEKVLPGIFYTPKNKGITPSIEELMKDIEEEAKKYM